MKYSVEFGSIRGFQDLELFYRDFYKHLNLDDSNRAVFDLTNLAFITPELVMPLVCATRIWYEAKRQPVEWLLNDNEVLRYLERAGAFSACSEYLVLSELPKDLWSRGSGVNLIPVTIVDHDPQRNSAEVPHLIADATDLLLGRVDPKRMGAVCTVLSEIAANITHSLTKGYALMQVYKVGTGHRVHIAVADVGIGIPTSLHEKYPDAGRSSDYLQLALKNGVTSTNEIRGAGLHTVNEMVRNGGGVLVIRSQTALLEVLQDGKVCSWDALPFFPGTQVFITMWGSHDRGHWDYLLPNS